MLQSLKWKNKSSDRSVFCKNSGERPAWTRASRTEHHVSDSVCVSHRRRLLFNQSEAESQTYFDRKSTRTSDHHSGGKVMPVSMSSFSDRVVTFSYLLTSRRLSLLLCNRSDSQIQTWWIESVRSFKCQIILPNNLTKTENNNSFFSFYLHCEAESDAEATTFMSAWSDLHRFRLNEAFLLLKPFV